MTIAIADVFDITSLVVFECKEARASGWAVQLLGELLWVSCQTSPAYLGSCGGGNEGRFTFKSPC